MRTLWKTSPLLLILLTAFAEGAPDFELPERAFGLFESHCFACHDEDSQKGDVRLDHLGSLDLEDRLDLLNRAQEQLFIGEMPPRKRKQQPTPSERAELAKWISAELKLHNASKLEEKLQQPSFGNYVDHDKLFSGEYANLKAFTPDRRWLISEYIFDAKMNRLLNHKPTQTIDGKRESVIGDNKRQVNLTNPFLLPTHSGVRYYDTTTLNGGHLLTMLTNAKEASTYMIYLSTRDKRYIPAIDGILALEREHERILASRKKFLTTFIEPLLIEIYEDEHAALLPEFVPVERKSVATPEGEPTKKAPFHAANPGNTELATIFRSMRRLEVEGDTDAQLIHKCEREWFNHGHNDRQIQARVTFLNGYMEEWRKQIVQHRYDEKQKPHVYASPTEPERSILLTAIRTHRKPGDRFNQIIDRCLADWEAGFLQDRVEAGPPQIELIQALVEQLFALILERAPDADELDRYAALMQTYVVSLGNTPAIEKLIQTILLRSDVVYRSEFGTGEADAHGRRMLSPRDASYAIAYALTDSSPDEELVKAVAEGRLQTREDYRREVRRLLARRDQYYVIDEGVQRLQLTASITAIPIRELRFFREFFGYPAMLAIFKDNKRFGGNYDNAKGRLVGEADRLIDHILEADSRVIETLLSTDEFYIYHSGDNESMTAASERISTIYNYFKDMDWEAFEEEDLLKHKEFLAVVKMRGVDVNNLGVSGRRNSIREFKTAMTSFTLRLDKGQTSAAPYVSFPAHGLYNASTRTGLQLRSPEVGKFFNIQLNEWNYPGVQPAPVAHRMGMLTHPAWLIAHAGNTATDPVIRGKWIREKLLAGTVPDLPITVDAVIPEDHHRTLRDRLVDVTEQDYCWKCHERMNPLGYAFEMYDDFGRYRTEEALEHPDNLLKKGQEKAAPHVDLRDTYKTLPVVATGRLDGTGDPTLDGEVRDAIDLAGRLARSDRVRQSVIRHAFRFFMGRNEVLSDSQTLIEADQAYLESGGSFDALIVSLLTSDSFIFRK